MVKIKNSYLTFFFVPVPYFKNEPLNELCFFFVFQVGYDDGLRKKLKSKSVINKYINSIWTHLQANFCHSTLGSKILVQQYGPIKHYPGKNIKKVSGINGLEGMESITEKNLGKANLMLYVAVDRGCKLVSVFFQKQKSFGLCTEEQNFLPGLMTIFETLDEEFWIKTSLLPI